MKSYFTLLIFSFTLLCVTGLYAQSDLFGYPAGPLKPSGSPMFGKDIIIDDQPDFDQRNVAVCSAFNGWLFAAHSYKKPNGNWVVILRSEDGGVNWTYLTEIDYGAPTCNLTYFNIITCGSELTNLKVFLGLVFTDTVYTGAVAIIPRFNPSTGEFEDELLKNQDWRYYDMAIANDYNFPASGSSPGSLACLFSKHGFPEDTIVFRSSINGGLSFNNRIVVAMTLGRFNKVALNYGASHSYPEGRYFAAWEYKDDYATGDYHIYTAHNQQNINSPFTYPVCIDSIDSISTGKVRNPVIACQYGDSDNDSANLTEVVLVEKKIPGQFSDDLLGYYNLKAATSSDFKTFNVSSSPNQKRYPDINYNPFNSVFMLTYFDSTSYELPFLLNDVNLANPEQWNIYNTGYNDDHNITFPLPKVVLNVTKQEGMNVWISNRSNGKRMALYDAPYSDYTSIHPGSQAGNLACRIYPNPATDFISIETSGPGHLTIMNLNGQQLLQKEITETKTTIDISTLPRGVYIVRLTTDRIVQVGKFVKQ